MSDGFLPSPFDVVREFLDGRKYVYATNEESQRVNFSICGRHADYRIAIRITGSGEILAITGNYPFRIRDPRNRPSVSELLTRANYAMLLGKFEMDLEDGEVRFHLTQIFEEGRLQQELVARLFTTSVHTMDRYFPAIMQLLHAGYTPGDAVFHAELDLQADQVVTDPVPSPGRAIRPAAPTASAAASATEETPAAPEAEASEGSEPAPGEASSATPVPEEEIRNHPHESPPEEEVVHQQAKSRGAARKSRRPVRRKMAGPENHPEFPF